MGLKLTRLLAGLTVGLLIINNVGCTLSGGLKPGISERTGEGASRLTIVTSFYPVYIETLNITQNIPGVQVINMTPMQPGCLHDYQLTPSALKALEKAQVFVVNGAGMEAFMDKVIAQLPNLKTVEASRGIELIKNNSDGQENPHVFVGISGAIQQVKNIGEQLAVLDPEYAGKYRANAAAYANKLAALQKEMHRSLDGVTNRDIVTFHEAFPYFAREFNLRVAAVVEREPGSQPSARELAETIRLVREAKVKALFAEPQYPAKAAETIARETEAKVYYLDPAVTGPEDPDAYINIMNKNVMILEEALK